jgi:hypothetical protein
MALDLKKPLLHATIAGLSAVALYYTLNATTEFYGSAPELDKKGVKKMLEKLIRKELREKYETDPPKGDDGILSIDFMVNIHSLMYRFKKYG